MRTENLVNRRIELKKTAYGYDAIELTRRKVDFNQSNYVKKYKKGDIVIPRAFKFANPNLNDNFYVAFLVLDELVGAHWVIYTDGIFDLQEIEKDILEAEIQARKGFFEKMTDALGQSVDKTKKVATNLLLQIVVIITIATIAYFLIKNYDGKK